MARLSSDELTNMMVTPNWANKSTEQYLTEPLTDSIKGLEETKKRADIQNQALNGAIGMRGSTYGGTFGSNYLPTRYAEPWLDTSFSQVPVELYNVSTGETTKKYNNLLDYQMDTMVVSGGATSKPSLGFSNSVLPVVQTAGIRALQGAGLTGGPHTPSGLVGGVAGGILGLGEGLTNVAEALNEAYRAFDEDKERTISLLAEESTDKDGQKVYKINLGKAAYGNSLSGGLVQSYRTAPTDTPATWNEAGTGLNINVAPAFANSDTYKEYIAARAQDLKGLTRDNDTDGNYLSLLNTELNQLQQRYFIDQQEAKALQAKFPEASEEAISMAIDNELTGYATKEDALEAPIYTFGEGGELVKKTAAEVFNHIYDMGDDKVAKDKYMDQLFAYLEDDKVSDSDRAILQGQINAIYAANSNSKLKYKGMLEKSYWDKIGESALLLGQSPNDVAEIASGGKAYGELKYLTENEITNTLAGLTSTAIQLWSTAKTMNLIESANRKVLTGAGKGLSLITKDGSKINSVANWLINNAANEAEFANIAVNSYKDLALKTAGATFDFGIQAVSDLEYDLGKLGLSKLAGNDMDFWREFSDDLALDLLFTFGHSGALTDALAKSGLNDYSVADLGRVIRENGRVTVDTATDTKTLSFSIDGRGDYKVMLSGDELAAKDSPDVDSSVKGLTVGELATALNKAYYAVNFESQQRAAQIVVNLANKHPILYKGYQAIIDKNVGLKMLGYRRLAETGDYTDLIKLSNAANSNKAVTRAYNRFANTIGAEGMQALNKASEDFTAATGRAELSEKDSTYINASQAWMRAQQDFRNKLINQAEYDNAQRFYNDSLNAVSYSDKVALDQLMKGLAAYAKAIGGFEVSERLQTSNFYENIQKYNGYIPLFAKRDGDAQSVEYRRAHRDSADEGVRIHPSAMENPVKAVEQYADAVIRNAARAEQVRAVIDVVEKLPGVTVSEDSTLKQDYEELPLDKLIEKYNIPKEASVALRKLADTETSYKKQLDTIIDKGALDKVIEEYRKAQAILATGVDRGKNWNGVLGQETEAKEDIRIIPDGSYADYYTPLNNFSDRGITMEEAYRDRLNNRFPDTLDSIPLTLDEKMLLADWDTGSDSISTVIDVLKNEGGNLEGFKNSDFLQSAKGEVRAGVAKSMAPSIRSLANKITNHQVQRPMLYRLEPIRAQQYEVGQKLVLPLSSFSKSRDITSNSGRFTTTRMFNKNEDHYILKTEPEVLGSMDFSRVSSFPDQKEVLVSDSFEVTGVKEVPTPKDMGEGKTYEVTLTKAPQDASTKYAPRTENGDPYLGKNVGIYKEGMTEAEIKEIFLGNVRESLDTIMSAAHRRNYKFRKYFTMENPKGTVDKLMVDISRQLDSLSDTHLMAMVTKKLTQATPMVTYNQLLYHWVDNDSVKRHDELISDPEILSGEAGYDLANNRKVKRADAAVRVMTDGRVDTIYLTGATKADREAAKAAAEVLNAPIEMPSKNALVRFMTSISQATAQLKRFNVSRGLPSRALPNMARDVQQAYRQVGISATLNPAKLVGSLIDPSQFSEAELSKIYTALDQVKRDSQGYTESEIAKLYRQGALGAASRLAGRPQAPTFEEQMSLRPSQRTANQIKYQWDLLKYNMGNFGKGGATDILLTPGNLAESATRTRVGQNAFTFELRNRLEAGEDFESALAGALEKGTWASRNSTTDFSTKGWLTEKMARFTPFSYSSFSDLASKIETFVMDPLGVSRRTAVSMAAYTMNLCILLSGEENRKRYMNMSDYQRLHSMMVDLGDGQLLTMPIDEAYAGLLTPIRTFVETLAYKEPVTFWKILGSFLQMGPVDLSGFTEGDRFNLQRGLETVVDSYAPALVSFAAEQATGRNFYYGSDIAVDDRYLASYGLAADSAGDYTQNGKNSKILHGLADLFNIPQWRLQHAFSLFTGTIGDYALHYLDKLQGATENEAYGKGIAQAFYKNFLPSTSGASSAFYEGINALQEEKQKLQAKLSANWNEQLKTTGLARTELQSERQKMLDDFALKVTDFISSYLQVYEQTGGLTKSEASSIYYLFDFTDDYQGGGFNVGSAGSQAYEEAQNQGSIQASVLSAQAMGANYQPRGLYKTAAGTWERETPNGTQALNRLIYNRNKEYAAQIDRIANDNNLAKGKSAASNQISAIYNKATAEGRKPTNEEYAQMDAIRAKWDVEAALALAPFFQANGLDMISSNAVAEELGQYFLVIGDAEKDNKGRYISASTLNKQRGFVQSFVKSIYEKAGIK